MSEEDIRPSSDSRSITVLCVGPNTEAVAEYIQQERDVFSVVSKTTLQESISYLDTRERVDCVVSNHQLPTQTGITLLRRVRDEYGKKPFVLLAREGNEAVAADAINADADGYFQDTDGETKQYRRLSDRVETVVEEYRTRQTQQETRKRLLRLAESSDSAVWLFTGDWSELLYVNSTYEDIWGRSRAALEEDPTDFLEGIHPDDRGKVKEAMGTLSEGEPVELEYRVNPTEDYQRWVEVQGEPVFDDSGNIAYVAGFARDITDPKDRRRELKERTRQLQAILDTIEASVFMTDPDGRYLLLNQASKERFGIEGEDVVGKRFEEVLPERVAAEFRDNIERSIEAGETVEIKKEIPTGEESRTFLIKLSPVYDESGNLYAVCGFGTDITKLTRREKQLERQNQEMEVFNSLLRHDVLNGITVIRTRADVLSDELEGDHRQHAETIVEWSDNMTGLVQRIRDVLNTLTGEEPELERTNLSDRLRHQVEIVETSNPVVEVETDIPEGVYVQANELLEDTFKNLLTNAIEHNEPEGLRIRITVDVTDGTARIRIADSGRGIPDELKDAIFRRGRTGHVKQTGSGFGLFFVDAMMTAYGGEVHVKDNEMGGATFVIELPVDRS